MIDLHVHSNRSDGQYPPAELAGLVEKAGISAWALTDHDTVEGLSEAWEASRARSIAFFPGIEVSAKGNRELHILGYGIDPDDRALREACQNFRKYRDERKFRILDYLGKRGVELRLEDVEALASGGLVGRPHFARAMVAAGAVSSVREAFDQYLGIPEFDKVERPKPTPERAIELITGAGGVAVLAHPQKLRLDPPALEALVRHLYDCGLRGIECYYSTHTEEEKSRYLSLAQTYGLFVTGGSDFHGELVKPEIAIGMGGGSLYVTDEQILAGLRLALDQKGA